MNRQASRSAFTLIEMLIVIGLLAVFMTVLSFFLVGLSNIWLDRSQNDFFDQHVDSVAHFLTHAIDAAAAAESTGDGAELPVEWARPPGFSDLDDPLLYFKLAETPALFVREGQTLPHINAYLQFDERDGLAILWYSDLEAEETEDSADLFRTPISDWVSKFEYAYYDKEQDEWEIEEDPEEGEDEAFLLPQFIRLTFTHPEEEPLVRSIYLPQRSNRLPLF